MLGSGSEGINGSGGERGCQKSESGDGDKIEEFTCCHSWKKGLGYVYLARVRDHVRLGQEVKKERGDQKNVEP